MKKYEILGGNLPVVVCELSAGESMITESGSMSWMSPNMKMETISGGGMKKMFGRLMSGDSMFQNRYTAEGADGTIAFASSFPGAIKALDIRDGHSMIVQKSAFLASEEGVELSMHFQKKLGKGVFGGEGFIMQKLSGNGTAFVEIDGHAVEYELDAGQEILISTGYLAAMEETCTMANMQKQKNRQLKNQYDSNDAFTSGISLNRQHWIIYQEKAGTIRCLNFEKQDVVILSVLILLGLIK